MKSSLRLLFFSILTILFGNGAFAQANDECSSARLLVVTPTCTPTFINAGEATQSMPPSECNNFTSDSARDVWFSFIATAANLKIKVATSAEYDAVLMLYSSCAGAEIACQDNTVNGDAEVMNATGLTIGLTYYIRVYHFQFMNPYPAEATIDICVYNFPPAPTNNECVSAIQLVSGTSCVPTVADAAEATESIPAASCGGFESSEARDVWFKFTATNSTQLVKVTPHESYDAVVILYSACNGTELDCADRGVEGEQENMPLTGLTVGTEYIVRVYHYLYTPI